jgi:hypothetical protein
LTKHWSTKTRKRHPLNLMLTRSQQGCRCQWLLSGRCLVRFISVKKKKKKRKEKKKTQAPTWPLYSFCLETVRTSWLNGIPWNANPSGFSLSSNLSLWISIGMFYLLKSSVVVSDMSELRKMRLIVFFFPFCSFTRINPGCRTSQNGVEIWLVKKNYKHHLIVSIG